MNFQTELNNINDRLLFNISFDLPEYSIYNWWIGSGNTYTDSLIPNRFDPHGLKYGKIYINNQLIDNSYTIKNSTNDGLNISVQINSDNSIIPLIDQSLDHLKIDDRIPQEPITIMPSEIQMYLILAITILMVAIAITDNNILDTCKWRSIMGVVWSYR